MKPLDNSPTQGREARQARLLGWRRREFLRNLGLGVACLPLTAAERAHAQPGRRNLMIVAQPQGFHQPTWRPEAPGPLSFRPLPPTLTPLAAHVTDLTVLPDLTNPSYKKERGVESYATMFYGLPDTTAALYPEPNGPTVDQVIGKAVAGTNPPTLPLGVVDGPAPRANGNLGASRCFWAGAGQAVAPLQDPLAIYQELFAGASTDAARKLVRERRSMLDVVGKSLERWRTRMGSEEKAAIELHMIGVRDLERQLARLDGAMPMTCAGAPPVRIAPTSAQFPELLRAQFQIAVAAFRCGLNRVVTLQLSHGTGANVDFGQFVPGIPARGTGYKSAFRNWADLAENPTLAGINHKIIVDKWLMERFAELIALFKESPVQGGTLLDDSAILWASNISDGVGRFAHKMPWMLAGSAGGHFVTGHCAPSAGKPSTGVLGELCRAMGLPGAPYGNPWTGLSRV